jgi:WD40 repeat protein
MQVYDLAWSPTGEYIIAGSTDNCARVYTAVDGISLYISHKAHRKCDCSITQGSVCTR